MAAPPRQRHPPKTRDLTPAEPRGLPPLCLPPGTQVQPPLNGCCEVNARCIEMLVHAARHQKGESFTLVAELRDLLESLDPTMRQRATRVGIPLVDMEFSNAAVWHPARIHTFQRIRTPIWAGSFPRTSAIQLARRTLLLAWNSLQSDPATSPVLLGMTAPVAEVISKLTLEEIYHIAQKRFRYVRPRWDDRPAVWRRLLLAAQTGDEGLMCQFNWYALQLVAGEFIPGPHTERTK